MDSRLEELKEQYTLGGRMKFLKEKDNAFRSLLCFVDDAYQNHYRILLQDEKARELGTGVSKALNFESDDALKGRIRQLKEIMDFINLTITTGESALAELQELEESPKE